jgi:hypothetical protein
VPVGFGAGVGATELVGVGDTELVGVAVGVGVGVGVRVAGMVGFGVAVTRGVAGAGVGEVDCCPAGFPSAVFDAGALTAR